MTGCIFCRIIAGEAPASIVHHDEEVIAFKDITPQAPTHILVVPIRHISSAAELTDGDRDLAGRLNYGSGAYRCRGRAALQAIGW